MAAEVKESFNKRVKLEEKVPYINFTESETVSSEAIANAKDVEGVKIIA